jgi:serpin B
MNQQIDDVAAQRAGEVSIPFAAELFGRVASAAKADANVFVSPYSVGTALALTLEGAKGDTAGQLKKAIGYGPDHDPQKLHHDIASLIYSVRFHHLDLIFLSFSSSYLTTRLIAQLNKVEGVELSVANALWVSTDFQIHQDYVKRAQELLSEARNLDFNTQSEKSRQIINSWVEEKTKDKIKDLLPAGYTHTQARTHTRTHRPHHT